MVDIKDAIRVIDYVGIPGRGSSALELAAYRNRFPYRKKSDVSETVFQ